MVSDKNEASPSLETISNQENFYVGENRILSFSQLMKTLFIFCLFMKKNGAIPAIQCNASASLSTYFWDNLGCKDYGKNKRTSLWGNLPPSSTGAAATSSISWVGNVMGRKGGNSPLPTRKTSTITAHSRALNYNLFVLRRE